MAEALINVSKQTVATMFCLHLSVPTCYVIWLAYPCPYPKLSSPVGWAVLPYIIWPYWLPALSLYLWVSWLLHLIFFHFPLSPHGTAQTGHVHSGPTLPFIYNKPSPPPYLGAVIFALVSFYFFYFHLIWIIYDNALLIVLLWSLLSEILNIQGALCLYHTLTKWTVNFFQRHKFTSYILLLSSVKQYITFFLELEEWISREFSHIASSRSFWGQS